MLVVRFELGAYPIFTNFIPKALKFYSTMKECSHNDLIRTSFEGSKSINSDWAQGIHYFLKAIGMEAFWNKYASPAPHRLKNISKKAYKNLYIHFLKNNQSKKFVFLID